MLTAQNLEFYVLLQTRSPELCHCEQKWSCYIYVGWMDDLNIHKRDAILHRKGYLFMKDYKIAKEANLWKMERLWCYIFLWNVLSIFHFSCHLDTRFAVACLFHHLHALLHLRQELRSANFSGFKVRSCQVHHGSTQILLITKI